MILASSALAQIGTRIPEVDLDTPGLVVEASVGWDDTVDHSTPIPVSFLFHNHSDRIIEGQLLLSQSIHGGGVALEEIVIAPGTTRRFASIQAMPDQFQCFALLKDGDQILWRRQFDLVTGSQFDPDYNYVLFIDEKRKLPLSGGTVVQNPSGAPMGVNFNFNVNGRFFTRVQNTTTITGEDGRPVRCLTVKPWEVPNHPGPLSVAQAMIFPDGADVDDLNSAQWKAVAAWLCQGGTIFAHAESRALIDRLLAASPLEAEPPIQASTFAVRRAGLGAIYEYPAPLFPFSSAQLRREIDETTARLKPSYLSIANVRPTRHATRQQADVNRVLVVIFFVVYALCVGVLLLFRGGRRAVVTYTFSVVLGASVLSALLGGFLRASQGDLVWSTVTQVGPGGAVQFARVVVQSAGGRNKQVAVSGPAADLQLADDATSYYGWNRRDSHFCLPFTWQPNRARNVEGVYQVNIPITAWGTRQLRATSFNPDVRRMDFELEFQPAEKSAASATSTADDGSGRPDPRGATIGTFSVKLVNHLPFDIAEAKLIIGVTRTLPDNTLQDLYHIQPLPPLIAGASHEEVFVAGSQAIDDRQVMGQWEDHLVTIPRIAYLGNASAWIIGFVSKSPAIAIDESRCDFVTRGESHLFVQEILPEDMPDPTIFFSAGDTNSEAQTVEEGSDADGTEAN